MCQNTVPPGSLQRFVILAIDQVGSGPAQSAGRKPLVLRMKVDVVINSHCHEHIIPASRSWNVSILSSLFPSLKVFYGKGLIK